MGNVTDARDQTDPPAVVTETESGGLFGGQVLADAPLVEHLEAPEAVRFVLRNKNGGLTVEAGDGERAIEPDGDYQALAAVTDDRVLYAVGGSDGDLTRTVHLEDVVSVDVDDGMMASTLVIATTDGERYAFPCRGDLTPVAVEVDGLAQAWARAYTFLENAREEREAAARHREADEFEAALEAADEAAEQLSAAADRLREVGERAFTTFRDGSAELREDVRTLSRRLLAGRAQYRAQEGNARWRDGDFERAYDHYETALEAFRAAIVAHGDEPSDDDLTAGRDRAVAELRELESAPLAHADQVAEGAASSDHPAPAAARWEQAIQRYQDVLYLDWGRDDRRFDGHPDQLKRNVVDAVDNMATARREAAQDCREAARDHFMAGENDAARRAFDVAITHLERAQEIVDEVAPTRETGLADTVDAIREERETVADTSPPAPPEDIAFADLELEHVAAAVRTHWWNHGWSTDTEGVPIRATREEPITMHAVVTVVHRPGGHVEAATVEAAAEAADDADFPVLATTTDLTDTARERADTLEVRIVDAREQVEAQIDDVNAEESTSSA